ncbi:Translation initiation factor IF3-1, mitochondrial-like protein [Drosera capensis]
MGLLCRIKQSNAIRFANQFNRSCVEIPSQCLIQSIGSNWQSRSALASPASEVINGVRFFAAPASQGVKKEGEKGPRMNEQIKGDLLRLVIDEKHSIVPTHVALQRARSLKMDLVEVARNDDLPVCKIIDYHREKYKKELKGKEKVKSGVTLRKGECKEIRFNAKTELKDLKMKADTVKRLMERGYRVKCVAMGKEGQDLEGLLSRLSDLIEDVAFVESGPKMESKQAHLIVRHIKFGGSKKSGKKATDATFTFDTRVVATSSSTSDYSDTVQSSGETDYEDSGSESDPETGYDKSDEISVSSPAQGQGEQRMKVDPQVNPMGTPLIFTHIPSKMPDSLGSRANSPSRGQNETENRYNQNTTSRGPGITGPGRFQDHRIPRPGTGTTPNPRFPQYWNNQGQNPVNGMRPQPHSGIPSRIGASVTPPKQVPGSPGERSPPLTGFGIFSAPGTDPLKKQGPSIKDVVKNIDAHHNFPTKPSPIAGPPRQDSPTSRSDHGESSSVNGGGRWGIFSGDVPSSSGEKLSENQTKFRQ